MCTAEVVGPSLVHELVLGSVGINCHATHGVHHEAVTRADAVAGHHLPPRSVLILYPGIHGVLYWIQLGFGSRLSQREPTKEKCDDTAGSSLSLRCNAGREADART